MQEIDTSNLWCELPRYVARQLSVYGQSKILLLHDVDALGADSLSPQQVSCDVACLVYDASDEHSFEHVARLYLKVRVVVERFWTLQLCKTLFVLIEISTLPKLRYPFLSLLQNGNQALCASNICNNPKHFVANIEYLHLTVLVLKRVDYKVMFTSNWRPCHPFRKSLIFLSENGSSIYSPVCTVK